MTKRFVLAVTIATFVFSSAFAQNSATKNSPVDVDALQVGDDAPDWEMQGSDGNTYKLSDYKGKQGVVVAWYPMALTGG